MDSCTSRNGTRNSIYEYYPKVIEYKLLIKHNQPKHLSPILEEKEMNYYYIYIYIYRRKELECFWWALGPLLLLYQKQIYQRWIAFPKVKAYLLKVNMVESALSGMRWYIYVKIQTFELGQNTLLALIFTQVIHLVPNIWNAHNCFLTFQKGVLLVPRDQYHSLFETLETKK